jgi:hypothetical protein
MAAACPSAVEIALCGDGLGRRNAGGTGQTFLGNGALVVSM